MHMPPPQLTTTFDLLDLFSFLLPSHTLHTSRFFCLLFFPLCPHCTSIDSVSTCALIGPFSVCVCCLESFVSDFPAPTIDGCMNASATTHRLLSFSLSFPVAMRNVQSPSTLDYPFLLHCLCPAKPCLFLPSSLIPGSEYSIPLFNSSAVCLRVSRLSLVLVFFRTGVITSGCAFELETLCCC